MENNEQEGSGLRFSLFLKKIKFFLVFTTLTFLMSFVYTYYTHNKKQKVEDVNKTVSVINIDTDANKKILEEDLVLLKRFTENATAENQDNYLSHSEQTLKEKSAIITEETKNFLLLRRAYAASSLRNSQKQSDYFKESLSIYKKFIYTTPTNTTETYLKDFSIIFGTAAQVDGYFLGTMLDNSYKPYAEYRAKGYNEELATLLSLNDLSQEISTDRSKDTNNIINLLLIETSLINNHKEELTKVDFERVLSQLGKNLAETNGSKSIIVPDSGFLKIRKSLRYAFAFDIYSSIVNQKKSTEINEAIDKNYEAILGQLDAARAMPGKDSPLNGELKFYYLVTYLVSLERRYGKTLSKEREAQYIQETLTTINSSKETKAVADSVFKRAVNQNPASRKTFGDFIKLANKYPELDSYLKSIGVKKEDF